MPGQGRLAISRLRVPNLDGFVITAADNFLSIGAPRHRTDPEITRSHHTNQQKQRGKYLKKNLQIRVPGQRALENVYFEIIYISIFSEHLFLKKSHVFEWLVTQGHSDRKVILLLFFYHIDKKTHFRQCPVSVESQWPVEMSQILMVLSALPLATSLPSGEKATELTL